jgi:hypothetical protein
VQRQERPDRQGKQMCTGKRVRRKEANEKAADFIFFNQVVKLFNNKDHLSIEGLIKILNIKASMN